MDFRTGSYLSALLADLADISDQTLETFRKSRLASRFVEEGKTKVKVSSLKPTAQQRAKSHSTNSRYELWALQIGTLLGKYSLELKIRFSEIARATSSYILLERVGRNLTERKWRELFVTEFTALISNQRDMLVAANNEFVFHKPHFWCFKNFQPCNVDMKYDPRLVFVLMPFASEFSDVYEVGIKPAVEAVHLRCARADEIIHSREIICRSICQPIQEANLVIADITGRNPNVYYELGLCHGFEKEVLLIVQSIEDVPFDLRGMNIIVYSRVAELKEKLSNRLAGTIGLAKPIRKGVLK